MHVVYQVQPTHFVTPASAGTTPTPSPMGKQEQHEISEDLTSYRLDGLASWLKEDGGLSQVAEASLAMAHLCGLTIVDLKAFHETVPSFNPSLIWIFPMAPSQIKSK